MMQNHLVEAVHAMLCDPHHWDEDGGCSMASVFMKAKETGGDAFVAACSLIEERRAYVAVPLSLVDFDTVLAPVTWVVGSTTKEEITNRFGPPHRSASNEDGSLLTYDIYVEEVGDGYPAPPEPYAKREADAEDRPASCDFPYVAIWPPEALQVIFGFTSGGILESWTFAVGERVT